VSTASLFHGQATITTLEEAVKHVCKGLKLIMMVLSLLAVVPVGANAQMSKIKTVWVILMENHNWSGNNCGAAFGDLISKATR
jgi:hypothetical protein